MKGIDFIEKVNGEPVEPARMRDAEATREMISPRDGWYRPAPPPEDGPRRDHNRPPSQRTISAEVRRRMEDLSFDQRANVAAMYQIAIEKELTRQPKRERPAPKIALNPDAARELEKLSKREAWFTPAKAERQKDGPTRRADWYKSPEKPAQRPRPDPHRS